MSSSAGAQAYREGADVVSGALALLFVGVVAVVLAGSPGGDGGATVALPTTPPAAAPAPGVPGVGDAAPRRIERSDGKLPLSFVENRGQTDARVSYSARGAGFGFYFTKQKAVLAFAKGRREQVLDMRFVGANPNPRIVGAGLRPGKVNQLAGSRPAGWRRGLPAYRELRYRELWPGIDMIFRGRGGGLEYEFTVAPGASVSDIRLAYEGADGLSLDRSGRLLIATPLGTLTDARPRSYQRVGGRRVALGTRFVLEPGKGGDRTFGFSVPGRDPRRPLLVDPRLAYSTYLGGSVAHDNFIAVEGGTAIAVDAAGHAYVAGYTRSVDFPTTAGTFDTESAAVGFEAFVTKLDPTGSEILYSTFLGGEGGAGVSDIAVDSGGNAYVAGGAGTGFPTTAGAFDRVVNDGASDAFVAKLNPTGTGLVYSTYVGGVRGDRAAGIALDGAGSAYIAGTTNGDDFPTTEGAYDRSLEGEGFFTDAFITKLNPAGSELVFSTYLGASGDDEVAGVALDSAGSPHVTGVTHRRFFGQPTDFPVTAGALQTEQVSSAYVTKLDPVGAALAYSTYLGASLFDSPSDIAVDAAGSAYVTGHAREGFPTTPGAYDTSAPSFGDGFLAKLNGAGSALDYSTFLGERSGASVTVDDSGSAWVAAPADSGSYAMKLNASGSEVLHSTALGDVFAGAIAVDHAGDAYVTGWTSSAGVATEGAFDFTPNGDDDVFVAKVTLAPGPTTLSLSPESASRPAEQEHCVTATAREAGGGASANVAVRFTITGTHGRTRTEATGVDGEARLCYSTTQAGTDDIAAYADSDRDRVKDAGEPAATATVEWTPRAAASATIVVDGDDATADADGCGAGAGPAADPCNTIQTGVDVAAPGDTVEVRSSATVYVEGVTVDKAALRLVGPQHGVPAYDRPEVPGLADEAILKGSTTADAAVTVDAPGVLVSGLAIRDTFTHSRPEMPAIDIRETGATVSDTVLRGNGSGIRISAGEAEVSGNAFYRNKPFGSFGPGIGADAEIGGVRILGNVFDDNGNTAITLRRARDVVLDANVIVSPDLDYQDAVRLIGLTDVVVQDNVILGADRYGIAAFGLDGLRVSGNVIAESYAGGMQLSWWDGGGRTVRSRDVVVSSNQFVGNGTDVFSSGAIHVSGEAFSDRLQVVANRIAGNYLGSYPVGIWLESPGTMPPVDAENNWWGCNTGPEPVLDVDHSCDGTFGGSVDADPWIVMSFAADPIEVSVLGRSTLTADIRRNSAGNPVPGAHPIPDVLIDLEVFSEVGTLSSPQIFTTAGVGTATLTSSDPGLAEVAAVLDYADATAAVRFTEAPAGASSTPAAPVRDFTVPVVTGASMSPRSFAVNRLGAAEKLLAARAKRGTTLRYTLSEPATVTVSIERASAGRREGRKCRRPARSNRGKRRCTRYRLVGRFAVASSAGRNSKPFSGKLGRRALAPGRYRAALVASDAAGNRSRPQGLAFRVVRK